MNNRGFASAVRAKETENFTPVKFKTNFLDCLKRIK